jgi:alkylated DNA repair protein (DNA oxidative demethylase)
MARARVALTPPDGLVYQPDFLTAAEEDGLLGRFDSLDFQQIVMKGVAARRTAVRYGSGYDYDRRTPTPDADPIPPWLVPVRDRAATLAGLEDEELVQVLIQRYPPGAPIGWHRDSPAYDVVAGVSLGSAARMRLRRGSGDERVVHELQLEPRSAYVLAGESRWKWEHHVPPAKELRYSITFRSLRSRSQ